MRTRFYNAKILTMKDGEEIIDGEIFVKITYSMWGLINTNQVISTVRSM